MESKQLWTIVGVALVVAVIASLATTSITGNFSKVIDVKGVTKQVYTISETYSKAEINNVIYSKAEINNIINSVKKKIPSTYISLNSENKPLVPIEFSGKMYKIELVSASDTKATIKVTNSSGNSDTKEVSEGLLPELIQGLTIKVYSADEANLKLSAELIVSI